MDNLENEFKIKTKALLECRQSKNFKSCSQCDEILECKIRKDYVKATFDKLSGTKIDITKTDDSSALEN